jgi:hypothetical protein
MEPGNAAFIIIIIALSMAGWLINNWIRAKHGYALEDEWGGKTALPASADRDELVRENAALRGELKTVHERVAVLERIVTDKGYGLREEIEALRENRAQDAGVPLDLPNKERA